MADEVQLGDDNDTYDGENGEDIIRGGGGDDILDGGNAPDEVYGEDGNDTLNGGNGDDAVYGGAGDDVLTGDGDALPPEQSGNGDDLLEGGTGDDQLTGGRGDDTFVFNFVVSESTRSADSYSDWAQAEMGITVADGMTQDDFAQSYSGWLAYVIEELGIGADADNDGIIEFGMNQNDPTGLPWIEGLTAAQIDEIFNGGGDIDVKVGRNTQDRYYSEDAAVGGELAITASDGNDVVIDFGKGVDKLDLRGITEEQALILFDFEVADVNDDGLLDTVLSWEGGSIVLSDFSAFATAEDFFNSDWVAFGG